jgi:hypothetical protein
MSSIFLCVKYRELRDLRGVRFDWGADGEYA